MRLLVLVLLFSLSLFAKDTKKAIEVTNLKDGTSIIKINLNYEYTGKISHRIRGSNGSYGINIPIPGYWDVLSVNGYLSYNPSITLDKDTSSGAISLNDTVIKQFRLSDNSGTGIKFKVNPKYLKQYNWIKFEMFQHLTNSKANCDDSLRDDIWTEINLADSYLEFHIRKKPIPEQIDSLTTHMIDSKQYELEPINFVVSEDPTDEELRQYAMLSGAIANSLVYRIAPISVSKDIDFKKHNVIVTTRDKAKDRLAILDNYFFFDHNPLYAINFNSKNSNEVTVWSKDDSKKYSLNKNGITLTSKSAFFGKSLSLYGSKLKLTDLNLEAESEITVSFWFNANRVRGKSTLFSFDKYSLVLNKNSIGFSTGVKGLYGSKYRVKSGWHHIVATFSSTNIKKNKLFIDGKKLTLRKLFTKRRISMLPSFSSEIAIGGRVEDNKYKFKGLIDQVYIFTTSLEDSFVKKLYARSSRYKNMSYNESLFIVEKITHDINIIRNPVYQNKAILLISPKDSSKIDEVIYGFNKKDLSLYTRQGLNIDSVLIPKKAKAYSSPGYIPVDRKIEFNELGYKTKVVKGMYPPAINIKFKVYPDHYFDTKDRIKLHLNYTFPTVLNPDSVSNIFLNDKFAKQINILEAAKSNSLASKSMGLLDFGEDKDISAYLVNKGKNSLRFEFSLVPLKKGGCAAYNKDNLLVMIMDNSYFKLPSSDRWIEMPYMKYINTSAYPYSVYPDLQDTQIVLTNTDVDTIAAAMNFTFYLAHEIESFPYYISVTKSLNKIDKDKQIVIFGTIHDKALQLFSENANISFSDTQMSKEYPFIKRLIQSKDIADDDRLKKFKFVSKMVESSKLDDNLLMQMFQSPFNDEKTVLMFATETASNLNFAVKSILSYEDRHFIDGDTLIYNPNENKGISFNIADKYILTSMNIFDRISLQISLNPIFYLSVLIIIVLIFTWYLRNLLLDFKRAKHPDVE